jgi:hypothetical protein
MRTAGWLRLGLLTVAIGALDGHARGANSPAAWPSADQEKAAALVRQLGDKSFTVRERASNDLVQMGRAARAALTAGFKDPDLEIRRRCGFILPMALKRDLDRRLAVFIADKEGKLQHDLPGWERYRKTIGSDAAARAFFADMQKADATLLDAAENDPRAVGDLFGSKCQVLQQLLWSNWTGRPPTVSLPDVATLLFVGTDPNVKNLPQQANWQLTNLLSYQFSSQLNTGGTQSAVVKKMLLTWITQRTDANSVYQALELAVRLNLKECLPMALKEVKNRNGFAFGRSMAIVAVAKLGAKEHRAAIEELLTDKGVVTNFGFNNVQGTTEVRDVALAMLVVQSGQKLRDYGYAAADFFGNFDANLYSSPTLLGFADQGHRDAALKKWQDWSAKQPKKK